MNKDIKAIEKEIQTITLEIHQTIKDNQNAKEFVLRRLIEKLCNDRLKLINELILAKMCVYERNTIQDAYNKEKYKKYRKVKLPIGQKRLEC